MGQLCPAKEQGFAWVFDGFGSRAFRCARQAGRTHFEGPSWTLGDGSPVSGELLAKLPSPKRASIPWLLLKVKSHKGAEMLDGTSFIRPVDTNGGGEPAGGCDAAHRDNAARVPYTAT